MADTLVLLQLEHRTIARLLALVEEQAARLAAGETGDLELLGMIFEYFVDYPDLCHHPKEDLVFRRLEMKDPETAESVGNLLLDHQALGELTASVAARVSGGASTDASELSLELEAFVREYRLHLEAEEGHFFPAITKNFDRDDWDLIDFTMFDQKDPLYDESTESRFLTLRKRIWEVTQEHDGEMN